MALERSLSMASSREGAEAEVEVEAEVEAEAESGTKSCKTEKSADICSLSLVCNAPRLASPDSSSEDTIIGLST
jgi:hypothetical protein